ncbi:MSHA biogenesis protein MshK [Photobacterium japonica]|uniref:MSHA biogenesis protein MshK n=1 Tax=Photobacterium japonica TaxID=2910235 RepID=UPI003D14EE2B
MVNPVKRAATMCVVVLASVFTPPSVAQDDPTAPLSWQALTAPVRATKTVRLPQLQSIVCQETVASQCYAILNGRTLALGARIQGYTLSAITEDEVRLARGGRQWRLRLFADNVITE